MKQLALIGSTASGKSDLAIELALAYDGIILSIDSLSIYKEIDIASAKPSPHELSLVKHFGINCLTPDISANVFTFIDEYRKAHRYAKEHSKNLIIVGGSSFYLKSMLDGLSHIPSISESAHFQTLQKLENLHSAYEFLSSIDPITAKKLDPSDRYRIEKMLDLYFETMTPPAHWFELHPPKPFIEHCPVLELKLDREILRERISLRTQKMVEAGLIDEVCKLERIYGRSPNSMKAIGIIEVLAYMDGKISFEQMEELITIHTSQLAKRQQTFNANQFLTIATGTKSDILSHSIDLLQ